MSDLTTVARPYAKAIFCFALEQSNTNQDELVHWEEMLGFLSELICNKKIKSFLSQPIPTGKQAEILIQLCDKQIDEYGQNIVRLMAKNVRLNVIPTVYDEYKSYVDEYRKITDVYVKSAFALTEAQTQRIKTAMEKRLAQKVRLNCSVDKSLIGGLIIRTKDFVLDGSSQGQIQRLAQSLQL